MKTVDFTQHLLNVQSELFRFAFKLTAVWGTERNVY